MEKKRLTQGTSGHTCNGGGIGERKGNQGASGSLCPAGEPVASSEERYHFIMPQEQEGVHQSVRIEEQEGVVWIHLHIERIKRPCFPKMLCKVTVPSCGVHYLWNPKAHLMKALNLDWFQSLKRTNGFTGAPVQCLIGSGNENRAALAISDTLDTFTYSVVPIEETGEYSFEIELFSEDVGERAAYDMTLRLDLRPRMYYEVLKDTARWWAGQEGNHPAEVPQAAKSPMYSTWYSFHQMVEEEALLKQCRIASQYGLSCLLLDDGWQTDDSNRGYAYCGDWENAASKIPDMKQFVRRVHEQNMKVMVWYSVPFIGVCSKNFEKYKDMLIDPENDRDWHVLDPRYPQVREFIIHTYEKALMEWDLDGFKLDFVDEFVVTPFTGNPDDERRDFQSFTEAADCLMRSCIQRLKKRKPDILLEFRQTYNGPKMRSYGNIFRAVDCPFDDLENHVRVTDIRLLAGDSAVHSDMLMWHEDDTPESAALQIIQVMFGVPQISMRLEKLSEAQGEMLRFYLNLWQTYKEALVNGEFEPENPSCRYNVIMGHHGPQLACTYHSMEVIQLKRTDADMLFMNGSGRDGLYLDNQGQEGMYHVKILDCRGKLVSENHSLLAKGLNSFEVPRSGVGILQA